jgi:hypothetical protein
LRWPWKKACTNIIEHSNGGESDATDKTFASASVHPAAWWSKFSTAARFDFHGHVEVSPEHGRQERLAGWHVHHQPLRDAVGTSVIRIAIACD